jgi:hypothetical protein
MNELTCLEPVGFYAVDEIGSKARRYFHGCTVHHPEADGMYLLEYEYCGKPAHFFFGDVPLCGEHYDAAVLLAQEDGCEPAEIKKWSAKPEGLNA